ncbi:MAG TPA: hypothetical protein VGT02_01200 [Methylomirabilota bacterium]|nr:hypothetical protein [Methylomirabilota bacterium]
MKLVLALLLTAIAATAAAQSLPRLDTSGWKTLRDTELGFEVKHPPSWRVGRSTGSLESVLLGPPAEVGKANVKSQFFVQRDRNPKGLTIEQWHADELTRVKMTPGIRFTNTTLGGRPAILMEATNSMGKHFTFFTTAHKSDIFNVVIIQPAEQTELDRTHSAVLATLKLLD